MSGFLANNPTPHAKMEKNDLNSSLLLLTVGIESGPPSQLIIALLLLGYTELGLIIGEIL